MSALSHDACECSKYIIATTIYNDRLSRVMEDFQLLDDAQEGFRRHRSTKRQVSKLQGLLAQQCRDKSQSVVLFLDIKNAFNAVNHRAIFSFLEAYGFNKVDVDFFRQMYSGKFFSVGNTFGESAACFLRRGVFQGDRTSSSSPSTRHIRWCEPVGGAALLRAWMVHQDLVDLRMILRFTQAAVMPSPLCAHWLIL